MIIDFAIRIITPSDVHTDGWYSDPETVLEKFKLLKEAHPNAEIHIVERMLNAWIIEPADLVEKISGRRPVRRKPATRRVLHLVPYCGRLITYLTSSAGETANFRPSVSVW
jgi:hypothetical protein